MQTHRAISTNPEEDAVTMPPEATANDDDKVTSPVDLTHNAVLKRFDEIATKDYPFPVPERTKPSRNERLVDPKSRKNLQPLLSSILLFLTKIICPPLTFLLILIAFLTKGTLISSIVAALAFICSLYVMSDPFFVHWITDGRFGGLGSGGTNNHGPAKKDGIYCADNPQNNRIRTKLLHFLKYRPTPYLYSGDLLTLAPFLLFKGSKGGRVPYKRWWIKVPSAPAPDGDNGPFKRPTGDTTDDEAVALDIVFPPQGYQSTKVTFLVLHGLNGGSTEPYVLDLARRATAEGCTVGVMISRGLMKTPVRGMDSFHGARTSDVSCVVEAMLYALSGERRGEKEGSTTQTARIVLVGFSMGGIVAANYVAKSGNNSGLVGAISFSGTLCSEKMLLPIPSAIHSLSVWQPALAWGLKCTIVKPNQGNMIKRGITVADVEGVRTVVDIDTTLVCKYHGYNKVQDYYEDMSAAGRGDEKGMERLKNVKVPLLAVHAIDDPIAIFEVTVCDDIVTKTDNVMVLATKHGGHIGWPQGLFPSSNRWSFMIDIAMEYASTVVSPE